MVRTKPTPRKNVSPSVTESTELSPSSKNAQGTRIKRATSAPRWMVLRRRKSTDGVHKKDYINISKGLPRLQRSVANGKTKKRVRRKVVFNSDEDDGARVMTSGKRSSVGGQNPPFWNLKPGDCILKNGYIYESRHRQCRTPDHLPERTPDRSLYECHFCHEVRFEREVFIAHVQKHTCFKCNFSDANWVIVDRHVRYIHSRIKRFSCFECGYSTYKRDVLVSHIRKHLSKGKTFSCHHCGYLTTRFSCLKVHTQSHFSRPFQCTDCSFASVTAAALKTHSRVHSATRFFQCSMCDYRGADQCLLSSHLKKHSNFRPFECGECGFRAKRKIALAHHMIVHTKARPFACGVCDYAAGRITTLRSHMRLHTGERPYVCVTCGDSYYNLTSLTRHRERKHRKRL